MNVDLLPDICLEISSWLSLREVARLGECSKAYHRKWEPFLLATPASRQKLMFYGVSHGERWALAKAISYGRFPTYEDLEYAVEYILEQDAAAFAEFLVTYEPFRQLLTVFDPLTAPPYKRNLQVSYRNHLPMLSAAMRMAQTGETGIVDMLLTSRLGINRPLVADLQVLEESVEGHYMITPVWAYVLADFSERQQTGPLSASEGLQYLFHHGAVIRATTQLRMKSEKPPPSLLEMFWAKNNGFATLLNDDLYGMIRILIRKQAVRGAVHSFLLWKDNVSGLDPGFLVQRMVPHPRLVPSPEQKQVIVHRWNAILDLLLTPRNVDIGFQEELNDMLFLFLMNVVKKAASEDFREAQNKAPDTHLIASAIDMFGPGPGLPEELDPVTIRKLIEKGADIRWRPPWGEYKGRSILEAIAITQTQHHDYLLANVRPTRQHSFVNTLLGLGAERVDTTTPNLRGRLGMRGHPRGWFRFVQGKVREEDALLWCPTAGFLLGYRPAAMPLGEAEEGVVTA
ncbi:unnamed protein product [Clonostachys solani]|uniref:Uncharacterized protein n=1 Tax=Clonostachys solani TaxID=160281 RepID=A0A9P0EL43_9HYPO|nr:unnamed protein product [Clonostachys solani]